MKNKKQSPAVNPGKRKLVELMKSAGFTNKKAFLKSYKKVKREVKLNGKNLS